MKLLGRPAVPGWVFTSLAIHLFFAVTTTLVWVWVIVRAVRRFPNLARPNEHSSNHRFWGWVAAIDMACTAGDRLDLLFAGVRRLSAALRVYRAFR